VHDQVTPSLPELLLAISSARGRRREGVVLEEEFLDLRNRCFPADLSMTWPTEPRDSDAADGLRPQAEGISTAAAPGVSDTLRMFR